MNLCFNVQNSIYKKAVHLCCCIRFMHQRSAGKHTKDICSYTHDQIYVEGCGLYYIHMLSRATGIAMMQSKSAGPTHQKTVIQYKGLPEFKENANSSLVSLKNYSFASNDASSGSMKPPLKACLTTIYPM